jgi:hypothetical protein
MLPVEAGCTVRVGVELGDIVRLVSPTVHH